MLDSPSISTTAPRPAAAVRADRPADRPASASAFTTFVDALTSEDQAGRSSGAAAGTRDADSHATDRDKKDDHESDDACAAATAAQAADAAQPKAAAVALALAAARAAAKADATGTDDKPGHPTGATSTGVKAITDRIAAMRAALKAAAQTGTDAALAAIAGTDAAGTAGAGAAGDDGSAMPEGLSRAALSAAIAAEFGVGGEAGANSHGQDPSTAGKDTGRGQQTADATIASALRQAASEAGRRGSNLAQAFEASLGSTTSHATPVADAAAMRVLAATLPGTTLAAGASVHNVLASDVTAAMAARELPGAETGLQIIQAMRLQWSNGVGEAHINLEPNQFGDVSISLRVEQGQVLAKVQADVPMVREWLQSNQGWLRQSLADQGLTLHKLEITEPPAEAGHEDRRESSREGREKRHARRMRQLLPGEVFEVVA